MHAADPASAISKRWVPTLILAMGAAINYGDRAAMSAVLPAVKADLGLSDMGLGVLGSMFLWTYALSSPIAGGLADRYSRARLANWSLAIWSVVMFLSGFANGVVVLCALRLLLGAAESLYLPASIALVGEYHTPATRARGMTVLILGMSAGVIAGGAVAGAVAQYAGWRPVFWLLGIIGILFAASVHRLFPAESSSPSNHATRPGWLEAARYLVTVPSYFILLAKVMLAGLSLWIFFAWLPLYFHEAFQMDLAAAGLAGSFLPEFAGLMGFACGGWFSDWAARRTVRNRMLIQGLCYLLAAPFLVLFLKNPSLALVTAALLGFGYVRTFGDANEQSIVCEIIPARYRATAVGIMNMGATTAGGVGVVLAGGMKEKLGLNAVFAASSALFLIAGASLLFGYLVLLPRDIAKARQFEETEMALDAAS